MLKKLKKNGNKGFTLVELIVVLVILAILAALLIPALTGYIDKAKEKQIIAETRQAVMAAQTLVDEKYATKDASDSTTITIGTTGDVTHAQIAGLAELTAANISSVKVGVTPITGNDGLYKVAITELIYSNHGKYCRYESDATQNDNDDYYQVSGTALTSKINP